MERLSIVRARIEAISQLAEVVAAIRSLAAAHMQQAVDALSGARRYAAIVGQALGQALALEDAVAAALPMRSPRRALLVFTAEHGFVAGFNLALVAAARTAAPDRLFVVGTRGALAAEEHGLDIAWTHPMTSRAAGVADIARIIANELYRRFAAGDFSRLDTAFCRLDEGGHWQVERQTLLPLDLPHFCTSGGAPPHHYLPAQELVERLIEEYFLADLVRAGLDSLAAENAARLQAMSAAHDNIARRLEQLQSQERVVRQEQITEELLDVLAGAELARGAGSR